MPTIEKLVSRTGYLVDDQLDVDLAIDLFNEALEEIDTVYGLAKTINIPLQAGENIIQFPLETLEVIRIVVKAGEGIFEAQSDGMNDGNNYYGISHPPDRFTYSRFGDVATIFPIPKEDLTVIMEFYGSTEKIPSVSQDPSLQYVPKIPERYHRALPLYAASRYFENWEDNPEQRSNYRKQFEKIRDDMSYVHERKVRGARSNFVYIERGWE